MSANKQNSSSLLSLILIVLIILAGIFLLWPSLNSISAAKLDNQNKVTQKADLDQQLTDLRAAQAELQSASEITQATSVTAIPEKFEEDKLITLFAELAKKNQVTMGSISFSAPTSGTELIKKATISVSLNGNQRDLISFLKGIEGASRKMIVKNITVQLGKIQNVERATFNLSIETYFQNGI